MARVPPYDRSLLLNTKFDQTVPLRHANGPSRPKGWRAAPAVLSNADNRFGVKLLDHSGAPGSKRVAVIGFNLGDGLSELHFSQKMNAYLAQEVRSPFAGSFDLTASVNGGGSSREFFEDVFLKNFTCRLIFYQYTHSAKKPTSRKELASVEFRPQFVETNGEDYQSIKLSKLFTNPNPGQNFSFGLGIGVAVLVERTTPGLLRLAIDGKPQSAFLRIEQVNLRFNGKERNDKVVV